MANHWKTGLDDELKGRFTTVLEMSSKAFGCVLLAKRQAFHKVSLVDKVVLYPAKRFSDRLRFKFLGYRVFIFFTGATNLLARPFLPSSSNSLIGIRSSSANFNKIMVR
jgi:hypothetical protein